MMIQSMITQKLRKNTNGNAVLVIPLEESKKLDLNKFYTFMIIGPFSEIKKNKTRNKLIVNM